MKPLIFSLPLLLLIVGCPAGKEPINKSDPYSVVRITKSGTVIDCGGGDYNKGKRTEIQIVTTDSGAPSGVVVRNCKIWGSVRVAGLGLNGESEGVRKSSRRSDHTKIAQAAAPTQITLTNLTIRAEDRIPVYVSPGVTHLTLSHSKLTGSSSSVAVYLDAESARNTITRNTFDVRTGREVIAVDGSAHNIISHNTFKRTSDGGVFLYRNCGEGGTIRHQTPSFNTITRNTFNLEGGIGVWLGSRNGNRKYCEDDKGYGFGSSKDNRDFADNNIVEGNKFSGIGVNVIDRGRGNRVK